MNVASNLLTHTLPDCQDTSLFRPINFGGWVDACHVCPSLPCISVPGNQTQRYLLGEANPRPPPPPTPAPALYSLGELTCPPAPRPAYENAVDQGSPKTNAKNAILPLG